MKLPFVTHGFFCAGLLLFSVPQSDAQPVTPSGAAEKLSLTFAHELVASSDAELKGGNTEYRHLSFYQSGWNLSQSIPLAGQRTITLGLSYNLAQYKVNEPYGWEDDDFWLDYKNSHPNWNRIPLPKRLQSLALSVDSSKQINDRWSLSASVSTGSFVAKEGLLSDGWGTSSSFMAICQWSPSLTLAMGAAYNSLSHDYKFVPILGFDWRLAEKWSLAIGFPTTAITYEMNKNLSMSLAASGSGNTYHVRNDPLPGATPQSLANSKLETTEVRLGFTVDWTINATFAIKAAAGNVLYQEFKYIDRGYKLKSRNAAPFASIGGSISL